ncbi:hypothetical protein D3C71_1805500 [compost metagenome]
MDAADVEGGAVALRAQRMPEARELRDQLRGRLDRAHAQGRIAGMDRPSAEGDAVAEEAAMGQPHAHLRRLADDGQRRCRYIGAHRGDEAWNAEAPDFLVIGQREVDRTAQLKAAP